jgi:lipoprotein-releasing system permease protein
MFKFLLCWRYLRTRYIALASVVSVMLGVATMIVVNSVMTGFSREMQSRIHGVLADLSFESHGREGMVDADWHMEQIRKVAGECIEAMTPIVYSTGMMIVQFGENSIPREVTIVGVDEQTLHGVSEMNNFLQHPENRRNFTFELRENGFDVRDHQAGPEAPDRPQMANAGWVHRREVAQAQAFHDQMFHQEIHSPSRQEPSENSSAPPENSLRPVPNIPSVDPFASAAATREEEAKFDPAKQQQTGIVVGIGLISARTAEGKDRFFKLPGDDVKLIFATIGTPPKASSDDFTITDIYESKMSEYDSKWVFVSIRKFQQLCGMIDPGTGIGRVNAIQIKLKPGVDGEAVRDRLRAAFRPELYGIYTWRDKQGPLLAAVQMETAILNVLLFMIIAVAGFGILAIFYMIVVEKTRDIGILKSLGAPARGVMGIFLGYGLSLGLVGSCVGLGIGLLFVRYINQIADLLGRVTGQKVFDPSIYYFYSIPTIVEPRTVACIVAGAVIIAVMASILPARRAAGLHPVEALRYE